jgi:hypothetical protein
MHAQAAALKSQHEAASLSVQLSLLQAELSSSHAQVTELSTRLEAAEAVRAALQEQLEHLGVKVGDEHVEFVDGWVDGEADVGMSCSSDRCLTCVHIHRCNTKSQFVTIYLSACDTSVVAVCYLCASLWSQGKLQEALQQAGPTTPCVCLPPVCCIPFCGWYLCAPRVLPVWLSLVTREVA